MSNVPEPGDTTVPSARAERRRIRLDDASGIVIYAVAVISVSAVLLIAIMMA